MLTVLFSIEVKTICRSQHSGRWGTPEISSGCQGKLNKQEILMNGVSSTKDKQSCYAYMWYNHLKEIATKIRPVTKFTANVKSFNVH